MDLKTIPFDDTTIPSILQNIAWALRSVYHTTLQASPGHLVFGRDMVINSTYIANWRQINANRKKNTIRNNLRENNKRISYDYTR